MVSCGVAVSMIWFLALVEALTNFKMGLVGVGKNLQRLQVGQWLTFKNVDLLWIQDESLEGEVL